MATLSSPSLGRLIFNIRNLLNQPNPTNSFWADQELTEYVNEGIRVYFAEIVKNYEGQFNTSTTLDIVANTETVALPTDFFSARALYVRRTNGWEILPYSNDITGGFVTNEGNSSLTYTPYYFFEGNNIVLRPVPNFSDTAVLRLDYVQFPSTIVNGGDIMTAQVSPVFKQLIEMYGVYKAKLKESMVQGVDLTAIPKADLAQLYSQFKDVMEKRSAYPEATIPFNPEG